jgi:predicted XRE-type DNA-binding protein
MVHAYRGVGKTHFSLGVACAVATASKFLKWQVEKPTGVIFIDGEMPGVVLQERFAKTIAGMDGSFDNVNLKIITPDLQELGMPDLATVEGQMSVEPFITDDIGLVVLDNISTLCGSVQENKSDTWRPIQDWLLRLRARGKAVLLVHHDGKGGGQRGTSKKEDILDTVIQLRHPAQYSPADGAVFEVHFMKNRGLHGEDAEPFEASLGTIDGQSVWSIRKLEDSTLEKVKNLLKDGFKQKDIATELDITAGRVSQLVKRIKQEV